MASYSFGVEIEFIAEPHKVRDNLQSINSLYYQKIATALLKKGLKAAYDPLIPGRDQRRPQQYDKWYITRDGSLTLTAAEVPKLIAAEAISPILSTRDNWQSEIDTFWDGYHVVFHQPISSVRCGSHVHVSKGRYSSFTLGELKTIAFGTLLFREQITEMLVPLRRTNTYCAQNMANSTTLARYRSCNTQTLADLIRRVSTTTALYEVMQTNRYVLWNFRNTLPGGSGTIEFRGGRCLRGKRRTRAWVAFAVALIHWLLTRNDIATYSYHESFTTKTMYASVRAMARELGLADDMPSSVGRLNETKSWKG